MTNNTSLTRFDFEKVVHWNFLSDQLVPAPGERQINPLTRDGQEKGSEGPGHSHVFRNCLELIWQKWLVSDRLNHMQLKSKPLGQRDLVFVQGAGRASTLCSGWWGGDRSSQMFFELRWGRGSIKWSLSYLGTNWFRRLCLVWKQNSF